MNKFIDVNYIIRLYKELISGRTSRKDAVIISNEIIEMYGEGVSFENGMDQIIIDELDFISMLDEEESPGVYFFSNVDIEMHMYNMEMRISNLA